MSYDFLGSAYFNTTYEELFLSLDSIKKQTLKPNKVVLVIDGPLSFDLKNLLFNFENILNIEILELEKNYGLGLALRKGTELCSSEYVLRFDTDDFNHPMRAAKQIKFMIDGNYDLSSSWIYEFLDSHENILNIKKLPLSKKNIRYMLPFRNPFNHPSICFKLLSIRNLEGGYRNIPYYEDYDLWIRAIYSGLNYANLKDILVGMKSENIIQRRRGFKKILCELKLFQTFWENSYLGFALFVPSFICRSLVRLLPLKFLQVFYKVILRNKI